MKKFNADLIKVVAIGLAVGIISVLGIVQYQNNKKVNERLNNLVLKPTENVDDLSNKLRIKKIALEQKLKQVNIMVRNKTASALGSGVSIKYKGKFYVLTAGHMADNPTDELYLYENGKEICKLEIVKKDYDGTINDVSKNDLLLLQPVNKNIQPRYYTELAEIEPVTGTQVYIVGNPMGIEDVISDGRTTKYIGNFMYYLGYTYFGNSGGGVYNYDGKLIGIVSHMYNLKPESIPDAPDYVVNGAVRLDTILKFMEGVH